MKLQLAGAFGAINWKRTLQYAGLFWLFFIVFLYLTFPYDGIKNSLVAQIEDKAPLKVEISELKPFRLTGIQFKNVKIASQNDPNKVYFMVDNGRTRVHIMPFLLGILPFVKTKIVMDFDLYGFGGGIAGQVVLKGREMAVAANFRDFDLARMGADKQLSQFGQINLLGKSDGSFEWYINEDMPKASKGKVRLEYRGLRLMNSTVYGKPLPDIVFNDPSVIQLSLANKFLNIDEWSLTSKNLDVQAEGKITMRDKFDNSRIGLNFKIKPSEDIEDSLGAFAFFLPEPDDEGYYKFSVSGTPKSPKFKKR